VAEQVDFEHPPPLCHRQGLDRGVHLDAGVVDKRVQRARVTGDPRGERFHLLGLGDVEDDRLDAGRTDGVGVTVASHAGQDVESPASQFASG
jgi:hypothetical protein